MESMFAGLHFDHEILVDSRVFLGTITRLHKPREYRLRKVVARMRDAFERGDLNWVKWFREANNLSNALITPHSAVS